MVAVATQLIATSAHADVIYDYRGNPFTFCGFGCPGTPGNPDAAPSNWDEDYLIASLTFAAPLAPNLTFADDVNAGLLGFTIGDALGEFTTSGGSLPDWVLEDDGDVFSLPGLRLSTDAAGNIVTWFVSVDGITQAVIANPPISYCTVEECGVEFDLADVVAVNIGLDDSLEWDAGGSTPGTWTLRQTAVPEPTLLALGGIALAGFAVRNRRRRSQP